MKSPIVFQKYNHFVYQNGTTETFDAPKRDWDVDFAYDEDPIYDINAAFAHLHDLLAKKLLPANYYSWETPEILFFLAEDAGFASNTFLTKESFEEFITKANEPNSQLAFTIPFFYFGDCKFLLSSIQNALVANNSIFVQYFTRLSEVVPFVSSASESLGENICMRDSHAFQIMALLELYFIKTYAVLDLFCKFVAELENPSSKKARYSSADNFKKLWKEKKKLRINNAPGTIFEKCKPITIVESLRNSLVHDGSWEQSPTVHITYANQQVVERFMLFPDITADGRLVKVGNRKLFFGQGQKVNDILPEIHLEFAKRVIKTIEIIIETYFKENA